MILEFRASDRSPCIHGHFVQRRQKKQKRLESLLSFFSYFEGMELLALLLANNIPKHTDCHVHSQWDAVPIWTKYIYIRMVHKFKDLCQYTKNRKALSYFPSKGPSFFYWLRLGILYTYSMCIIIYTEHDEEWKESRIYFIAFFAMIPTIYWRSDFDLNFLYATMSWVDAKNRLFSDCFLCTCVRI